MEPKVPAAPSLPPSPSLESVTTIRDDGSHVRLHPADFRGRFLRARRASAAALVALFLGLPWIRIGGYPAVFLDLAERRFHLFGWTLAAQDMWLLFFLFSGLGFTLFFATALLGRVWCGWACPQTVFLEHAFRRIERWVEGDAPARRRLDAAPWTAAKVGRRAAKQAVFAALSLALAHGLLAYFVSVPGLWRMMQTAPATHAGAFGLVIAVAAVLYLNFAWFREQLCIVICPYGRLQSALIDDHSLVIGYDARRGEPRGKPGRKAGSGDPAQQSSGQPAGLSAMALTKVEGSAKAGLRADVSGNGLAAAEGSAKAGDCIDCRRCVTVCPTGIDIRQGLQIECIGCAACIDACDAVMARLRRPPGLIRYDSLTGLGGGATRWVRPRTVAYAVLLLIGAAVAGAAFRSVKPAALGVTRMVGAAYYLDATAVRNQFLVRLVNKRESAQQFVIHLRGAPAGAALAGPGAPIEVAGMGDQVSPLVVEVPRSRYRGGFAFTIVAADRAGTFELTRGVEFLGPDPQLLREDEEEAAHGREHDAAEKPGDHSDASGIHEH